jgi:hypothetical protein
VHHHVDVGEIAGDHVARASPVSRWRFCSARIAVIGMKNGQQVLEEQPAPAAFRIASAQCMSSMRRRPIESLPRRGTAPGSIEIV